MDYKVTFFKLKKEEVDKGKLEILGKEYLGSIVIDDAGVSHSLTLTAKAFRQCPDTYLIADRVEIHKV